MTKKSAAKKNFLGELAQMSGAVEDQAKVAAAAKHYDASTPPASGIELLDVDALKPSPHNPRANLGNVDELAASIKAQGLLVPLLVRPLGVGDEVYEVVSGHRRLKAAQQAGLDSVPCDVRALTDVQALEVNLTEQINKMDLTPLEEGQACRKLVELSGYTPQQVGMKLGQSTSWVVKRLALCGLAPEAAQHLAEGKVSLTVAAALAALPTQDLQAEALHRLEDAPTWEVGETAEEKVAYLREKVCRSLKGAPFDAKSETLVPEAGACTACPHNSASNRMPGLFDNAKASPTCANPDCFEEKAEAAWQAKTAKLKEAGAKILPAATGDKLFRNGNSLPYSSKYVDADAVEHKDKAKRTWAQLVEALPEDARPQLHVVRDREGHVRKLYLEAKAHEAVGQHLKLKWAKKDVAGESPAAKQKAKDDEGVREAKMAVFEDLRTTAFKHFAQKGLTLVAARGVADPGRYSLQEFNRETGSKADTVWFDKKATINELLAFAWWFEFGESRGYAPNLDDDEVKEVAKAVGLDLQRLLKAQLEARAVTAAPPAKKSKGGGR